MTDGGVKIISRGGNNFNQRSSKCKMSFVINVSSHCKHCRLHIKKFYNIIHRSSPPTTNHSKYTRIYVIAKNPVSADFEIRNIRNVNFNLRRKVTRIKNKERLERFGQITCNEEDTNFINKIFLNADKNMSTVLDPDSKEMELLKIHYEHIYSVKKNIWKNSRTRFDILLLNWSIALLAKTSHSIYEVISQVMQLPALSYVLRKTKEIVGAQNIVKDRGLNLCNVKTISGNLIGSNKSRVKKIKGALGFDDMYIK